MSTLTIFAKLYVPLLLAVFCWIVAFVVKLPPGKTVEIPIPGPIHFKVPVSSTFVIKLLLFVAGVVSISAYAVYDYSSLFPQHLTMQVFYDSPGIRRSLADLGTPIPGLVDSARQVSEQRKYFERLDQEVGKLLQIDKFFTVGYVHSNGSSYTVVKKIQGLQNYYVAESEGELTHSLEAPNSQPVEFYTKNKKLDTGFDYLTMGYKDLFHGVVLQTKYRQMLVLSKADAGTPYQELVFAATRVSIFPWPHISNTVYLAEMEDGSLAPIAYATFQ